MANDIVTARVIFDKGVSPSASIGGPSGDSKEIIKSLSSLNNNFSKFISGSMTGLIGGGAGGAGDLIGITTQLLKSPAVIAGISAVAAIAAGGYILNKNITEEKSQVREEIIASQKSGEIDKIQNLGIGPTKEKLDAIEQINWEYENMSMNIEGVTDAEDDHKTKIGDVIFKLTEKLGISELYKDSIISENLKIIDQIKLEKELNDLLEKRQSLRYGGSAGGGYKNTIQPNSSGGVSGAGYDASTGDFKSVGTTVILGSLGLDNPSKKQSTGANIFD